jgi:hypothetical protein
VLKGVDDFNAIQHVLIIRFNAIQSLTLGKGAERAMGFHQVRRVPPV